MSSVQISIPLSHYEPSSTAPTTKNSSGVQPAVDQTSAGAPNARTIKLVRDMTALLEAAARDPNDWVDDSPAYDPVPISPEEAAAGWQSARRSSGR